jgi:hypothetical protein
MNLQTQIDEARAALGAVRTADEAFNLGNLQKIMKQPVAGEGPEEDAINALKDAMDAIMGANEIVHNTKGQLTKRDKPKLLRFAQSLEGAAVDIMSAAKRLR